MKQVRLRRLPKPNISGALVSFILAIVLISCGTNSSGPTKVGSSASTAISSPVLTPLSTPTATSSSRSTSSSPLNPDAAVNTANKTLNIGNLRIQSYFGFQCPYGATDQPGLVYPMDQLVLASDRMTYSQDEIEQMRTYLAINDTAAGFFNAGMQPPPTLRWVSGGSVNPIPGEYPAAPCGASLKLTNTGNTPIQISQVGVRLEGHPQQNSRSYHLVDACTIISKTELEGIGCGPSIGYVGHCDVYTASIQIGSGMPDSVFSAVPHAEGCNTLTLSPSDQVDLNLTFSLSPKVNKNSIYKIEPVLTEYTAQREQTLLLSQFVSVLPFASTNHFSCYGLQGTTFTLEQSPVYTNTQGNYHLCM